MKRILKYITKGIAFIGLMVVASVVLSMSVYAQVDGLDEKYKAIVDWSKSAETGTVSVKLKEKTEAKCKIRIEKGEQKYEYDLRNDGSVDYFPLQMGDGEYTVKVCIENPKGLVLALASTYKHEEKNANAVFLNPSKLVNFNKDSKMTKKAAELVKGLTTDIEKAGAIYEFVIDSLTYDAEKAKQIASGAIKEYTPVIDEIVSAGKGICYDYATLFAAMLRSQGIPAKLVMGYVPNTNPGAPAGATIYHAWNEFYSKEKGSWIKINEMEFKGNTFERVDPTLDSGNRGKKAAMEFIGNGSNYQPFRVY